MNRTSPDYPIALRLAERRVLLVGAGRVAEGRVDSLLAAGAELWVVAPEATPKIQKLAQDGKLTLLSRPFQFGDCRLAELVLSAVDDLDVSRQIAYEAHALGLWFNAADLPELCDFHLPSVGRRGLITVAVSTAGTAPALAALARRRAMEVIGPEFAIAARVIGFLRARLQKGMARAETLKSLASPEFVQLFRDRKKDVAFRRVRELVGKEVA